MKRKLANDPELFKNPNPTLPKETKKFGIYDRANKKAH
jgi:hypothetical protein